jgi:hypothetical protein
MREYDAATARLAQAAKIDPVNARARVSAVRVAINQNDATSADTPLLNDLATPSDWLLSYLAGVTAAEQTNRRTGPRGAADIEAIRRFLAAARAGGGEYAHAVSRLATLELETTGTPSAETEAALDRIRQRIPGRQEYAFLHAEVLARQKAYEKARNVIAPYMSSPHPQRIRDAARRLMGYIVELEQPSRPGGAAPPRPAVSTNETPPAGPARSLPILRQLKPGEERLEGVLERIECVTGKGITFHLKTPDAAVTAVVPRFNDVEFITYRDDLAGTISCGPLKEPMKVFLTWKKGEDPSAKIAVAIEFLPKGSVPDAAAGSIPISVNR